MAKKNKKRKYQVILMNHGSFLKALYTVTTEEQAYKWFNELKEKSSKVDFPVRWNNNKKIVEAEYEIAIIKCKDRGDKDVTLIMDGTGSFQRYQTNEENWIVVDKAEYNIEESVWVYGYHPILQRKDFRWVYETYVLPARDDRGTFVSLLVFKNKLLMDINGRLEMVILKNERDAVRFFNRIEEKCTEDKVTRIAFIGDIRRSRYKYEWVDRIQELTGWDRKKIGRNSTRP
jgi:hypothetical protein